MNKLIKVRDIISVLLFVQIVQGAEIVILTGDEGTSRNGIWNVASGASMPINNHRGLYANVGGPIETYHFQTSIPETNDYTLQVYNTCYSPRSHQVTQFLTHNDGTETFVTDQDCQTDPFVGQWRTLGTFSFAQDEVVTFTITTEGSNNNYVGASAIRYVYESDTTVPTNTPPEINVSQTEWTVDANTPITITANAMDNEDGDLTSSIVWQSPIQNVTGSTFDATVGEDSFAITVSVSDSEGLTTSTNISVNVTPSVSTTRRFDFGCLTGPLTDLNLTTYNASALPNVGAMCDRYTAQLTDNSANQTLFYNGDQGRLDGVIARFPFTATLRNVGLSPVNQPTQPHVTNGNAYNFVGLHIHHIDFNNINSAHLVVGQRGTTQNTIEGKKTIDGRSYVNDIGHQQLPNGRADIRLVVDSNGHVTAFWQQPNTSHDPTNDDWIPYRGTGELPGSNINWGSNNRVLVGIITYAYYSNGVPFWGVADQLEVIEH